MSRPSRVRSAGGSAPAMAMNVGRRSIVVAISAVSAPAGMRPGPHITVGTRMPPSQVVALAPRRGPADPACAVMFSR